VKVPAHYKLNRVLVAIIAWLANHCTFRSSDAADDFRRGRIRKILLVRANFRLGDSILASAAIEPFRRCFARAKIDFVGWSATRSLFELLPICRYYGLTRRFPQACWHYLSLVRRLRRRRYDLAVDLSCSHSALGSFIVGLSGARWRAGLKEKSDRWLNVRVPRPRSRNKYLALPEILSVLGVPAERAFPRLTVPAAERVDARDRLAAATGSGPLVGVFVGGRLSVGKRWPAERFREVIVGLRSRGARVAVFVGPEEKRLVDEFRSSSRAGVAVLYEPELRRVAAMLSCCDLFVAHDSGPMHLACAVGTRTVALFQQPNFKRWGPPSEVGRIVYDPEGLTPGDVLAVCVEELSRLFPDRTFEPFAPDVAPVPAAAPPASTRRLPDWVFAPGFAQCCFLVAMAVYACFAPPSFVEETWLDTLVDAIGLMSLGAGALLRVWTLSHVEKCPLWSQRKPERLITDGPYAFIRHPIYIGNFLVAMGLIFLADAYVLLPLLFCLTMFQHRVVVGAEDLLLQSRFGRLFSDYRASVPAYVPHVVPRPADFSLRDLRPRAFAHVWEIVLAASFFEWLDSPAHREWLHTMLHRLVG
jgi:heptosyltransferase-3